MRVSVWKSLVLLIVALLLVGCEFTYSSFALDCSQFVLTITSGRTTVDNTGTGNEEVRARATDGAGNVLYVGERFNLPVNSSISGMTLDAFVWGTAPRYNPITVTYYNPANGVLPADVTIATFSGSCPGLPTYVAAYGSVIADGRINRTHIAAPVAIYPVTYGNGIGAHIYRIDSAGKGTLALAVTPDMIAAVPAMPPVNTLIAAMPDGSIAFYRLTTGEYQVNAGEYVVIFDQLHSLTDYYLPQ